MQWNLYKLTTLQRQNHKLQDCNPGAPPCNDGFAALYFPCGQSGPERRLCRQFIFSLPPEFVATFPVFFWYRSLPISPHLTPARRRAKKPFPLGQETQSANDFAFFNKTVGHENLPDKTVPFGGLPVKGRPIFWWRKEWNSLKQRLDHGTRESSMISPNFLPHLPSSILYVQSEQFLNCWQDTLQTLQFRGLKRPSAKQRNQHSFQFSSITTTVNK